MLAHHRLSPVQLARRTREIPGVRHRGERSKQSQVKVGKGCSQSFLAYRLFTGGRGLPSRSGQLPGMDVASTYLKAILGSAGPWIILALAVPIVALGERTVRLVPVLRRWCIPEAVIGGLWASGGLYVLGRLELIEPIRPEVRAWAWAALIRPEPTWLRDSNLGVHEPLLVAFFTCVGLNASWERVRSVARPAVLFTAASAALVVLQNVVGLTLATALGHSPLLGLVCGSVSMTGGHGTSLGFAPLLEDAGLHGAAAIGLAASTFGLLAGALLGGPVGAGRYPQPSPPATRRTAGRPAPSIVSQLGEVIRQPRSTTAHVVVIVLCMKAGAWLGYATAMAGLTLPVQVGGMLFGVAVRRWLDWRETPWFRDDILTSLGSIALSVFLAVAIATIDLEPLGRVAADALFILGAQVLVTVAFAYHVTFRWMGATYSAAVMAAGHAAFALGATPTAVIAIERLENRNGPAPEARIVVPLVAAFLFEVPHAVLITGFLHWPD